MSNTLIVLHTWHHFLIRLLEERGHDLLFTSYKGRLFTFLSLSLSFTHFTMTYKKHTSLISAKVGTDSSNYGKIDTIESIYRLLYLLLFLLLSTVNHHSSFIGDNNENDFMKGNQRDLSTVIHVVLEKVVIENSTPPRQVQW
jgi:phosphatidylglycerophosphate synthase